MKYLLIGENGKNAQELLDRIAAFLWDNGNVIYTRSHFQTQTGYRNMVQCRECFVVYHLGSIRQHHTFLARTGIFSRGFRSWKELHQKNHTGCLHQWCLLQCNSPICT